MLVAYFPKEKILVNADMYNPPAPGAPPVTARESRTCATLNQNIQRLKLDVAQHVGIHGSVGPNEPFAKLISHAEQLADVLQRPPGRGVVRLRPRSGQEEARPKMRHIHIRYCKV